MHRSGTSAATGLVHLLGAATCPPGDMVRGPWNPSGHFESRTLMHLNDALLEQMGRRWWYPPPVGDGYDTAASAITTTTRQARRVFRRLHRDVPWVWKDPRTSALLPFWRAVLDDRAVAVLVFRHPLEVAESLQRRHDMPLSFGLALWERYNRLLLAHARAMPVHVSSYDDLVGDPVGWSGSVRGALAELGVEVRANPDPSDVRRFVEPELRHSSYPRPALADAPAGVTTVYDVLVTMRGFHPRFAPPDVGSEPPGVESELAAVGTERAPSWRPPPWAVASDRSGSEASGGAFEGPGDGK